MKMIRHFIMIILPFLLMTSIMNAEEKNNDIHNELRELVTGIEAAVNTKKYEDLKQFFHKNMRVTTVNQNTIMTHEGIERYFNEWFGEGGYLISLKMALNADALTELYANNTMGIVRGSGVEIYKLQDGRDLDLKTRWTATVIKDSDSKWRILSLHIGTNFYDNAIYNEMSDQLKKWGMIAAFLSLLFGLGMGYFVKGRKQEKKV